jgi:hypothetical protein
MSTVVRRVLGRLDRTASLVLRATNRWVVPLENAALDRQARRFPEGHLSRVEEAITRGLGFFDAQEELTLDALATLTTFVSEAFEPRLASLRPKVRAYAARWNDPHLRLLDSRYDPRSRKGEAADVDLTRLSGAERPILQCLQVDRGASPDEAFRSLEAIDDGGDYGTTHKLLGCMILKEFSPQPNPAWDEAIDSTVGPIGARQRTTRARDIFYERAALLQWLGYHHVVRPAWIARIVEAQLPSGGWAWFRSLLAPEADQHPSALALAALLLYRDKKTRPAPTARPQLGRAFSLDL